MNILMLIPNFLFKWEKFFKSNCGALIAFILVLSLSGCGDSTEPAKEKFIMPLKVGNSWTYKQIEYDENSSDSIQREYTLSILNDSVYKSDRYFRPVQITDHTQIAPIFYLNRNDGLYILSNENNICELALKYPAYIGDTYIYSEDTIRVEDVNVEYTVPAGTFKCIKYVREYWWNQEIHKKNINYLSPGIGFIAEESYDKYQKNTFWLGNKTVLMSYQLK